MSPTFIPLVVTHLPSSWRISTGPTGKLGLMSYVPLPASVWIAYDDSWARRYDEHYTPLPGVWNEYDALGEQNVVEEVIAAPAVRNIDEDDYLSAEDVDEDTKE
jgi:hypothetical protein